VAEPGEELRDRIRYGTRRGTTTADAAARSLRQAVLHCVAECNKLIAGGE